MKGTPSGEGRKAGRALLAPSLNPFNDADPRSEVWEREWRSGSAEVIAERDAERKQRAGLTALTGL